MTKFEQFKAIQKEYAEQLKSINEDFLKESIKEIGNKFGNFAIFIRGYTPSFNDGEPCEHSSYYSLCIGSKESSYTGSNYKWFKLDDCEASENEEIAELLECNFDNFTSINSHLGDNEDFLGDIEILIKIVDEAYNTDFEVKIKFKDGDITLEHDDYYCGY